MMYRGVICALFVAIARAEEESTETAAAPDATVEIPSTVRANDDSKQPKFFAAPIKAASHALLHIVLILAGRRRLLLRTLP